MKVFTRDDILKLKAATLYVIDKCGELDYYHLFKILYFADRKHYATYGRRIINDTFMAMDNGPVPFMLYDAIKAVTGEGEMPATSDLWEIANAIGQCGETAYYYLNAKEQPDMDELSASDVQMLDEAIERYGKMSFGELRSISHDDAWKEAYMIKRNSEMNSHKSAEAAGASEDMMAFIGELETFDQAFV